MANAENPSAVGSILRSRNMWTIAVGVFLGMLMFAFVNGLLGSISLLFSESDAYIIARQFFMS